MDPNLVDKALLEIENMINNAETGEVKYFIGENEGAIKGIQCARNSYQHLRKILS